MPADTHPPAQQRNAGTVLVLDYIGRRAEAPVESLDLESEGFDVHYLLEPPYLRELTAADYAIGLLDEYGPFGPEVVATLAYCMAAPIAQELTALVSAETDREIPLVLFDAEPVTARALQAEYLLAGRKLGELLSLPAPDAVPPGEVDEDSLRNSPAAVLEAMHQGLLQLGTKAVDLPDTDPEEAQAYAAEVAEFYVDWLAHLVAGHNTSWPTWRGAAFHLVSEDHPAQPRWPGAPTTWLARLPTGRVDLLRHPDTRAAVLSMLRKQA